MLRFAELFPDFMGRGISLTLTADNDFVQTNEMVKELIQYYPTLIVNFVNSDVSLIPNSSACDCGQNSCVRSCEETALPTFLNWSPESLSRYHQCWNQFHKLFFNSVERARKEYPLFYQLFVGDHRSLHKRKISRRCFAPKLACSCIPGAVRLYCSISGDYFPCEKVETTDSLKIGSVQSGIEMERVESMIQYLIETTDCDRCSGKEFCSICPNQITENGRGERCLDLIKNHCGNQTRHFTNRLTAYTQIMEQQPSVLDIYKSESTGDDWLPHIQFVMRVERTNRV
jgi:hypothetical protein